MIDDIANAVGVPTALIYGEKVELDSNIKAFRQLCIAPLVNKLQDELIAKIISRQEYIGGKRIEIVNVLPKDILEYATQIDKLVSSGTFLRDEVRNTLGYDPLANGEGQHLIMTKNYQKVLKGGDEENDGEN